MKSVSLTNAYHVENFFIASFFSIDFRLLIAIKTLKDIVPCYIITFLSTKYYCRIV